jgi:hypothetical protein
MALLVANGAALACSFALPPSPPSVLTVTPTPPHNAVAVAAPLATIADAAPITNIKTFGMCTSPANPAVQTATTAAGATPTPAPCVPATAPPWAPPAKVLVGGVPAFDQKATCQCKWGGIVAVVSPGQVVAKTVP